MKFIHNNKKHSISRSVIISYLLFIIIPMCFLWFFIFHTIKRQTLNELVDSQQTQLEIACSTLESTYVQIKDLFTYVQNNDVIMNYMDGSYTTDADMIYNLKKSIRPFFNELSLYNSDLQNLTIYCKNLNILKLHPEFYALSDMTLSPDELSILVQGKYNDYLWVITPQSDGSVPEISCYTKYYSIPSYKCLGYQQIKISPSIMENLFSHLTTGDNHSVYMIQNGTILYSSDFLSLDDEYVLSLMTEDIESSSFSSYDQNYYVNSIYLKPLNCSILQIGENADFTATIQNSTLTSMTIGLCILIIFSLIYFHSIHRLSRRITLFADHIESSANGVLTPYFSDQGTDEFTALIQTYNSMIEKNQLLTTHLHSMELMTKDAQYAALQAKIHPHFIYGTLESIRMLALQNDDFEVEKIILAFSSFMRYSLSNTSQAVKLKEEITMIQHYLEIQQLRFAERLNYSIQITPEIEEIPCPPFILQPLIENAIVHGISKVLHPCQILISCQEKENSLLISIGNNGDPPSSERLIQINEMLNSEIPIQNIQTSTSGYALYNIKERLRLFYKNSSLQLKVDQDFTYSLITITREDSSYVQDTYR